jgi:hypothetical protein
VTSCHFVGTPPKSCRQFRNKPIRPCASPTSGAQRSRPSGGIHEQTEAFLYHEFV